MVTREPEWDDSSRERALSLHQYENSLCKCGCGQPVEDAYNTKQPYTVRHFTCQAGRAIEQVRRKHNDEAKRSEKPDGWNDGRHYYVEPAEVSDQDG